MIKSRKDVDFRAISSLVGMKIIIRRVREYLSLNDMEQYNYFFEIPFIFTSFHVKKHLKCDMSWPNGGKFENEDERRLK